MTTDAERKRRNRDKAKKWRDQNRDRLRKSHQEWRKKRAKAKSDRYREKNRVKARAATARWAEQHPNYRREYVLRTKYELTTEGLAELMLKQGNDCAICGIGFNIESPHVDHDHDSGEVRGILCRACNSGIGFLKDSSAVVASALRYLRVHDARKGRVPPIEGS